MLKPTLGRASGGVARKYYVGVFLMDFLKRKFVMVCFLETVYIVVCSETMEKTATNKFSIMDAAKNKLLEISMLQD